jgi:hypothetical protein
MSRSGCGARNAASGRRRAGQTGPDIAVEGGCKPWQLHQTGAIFFLDHGRVFVETPLLMTNGELADVLAAFVAEVTARTPKLAAGRTLRPVRKFRAPRQQ